MAAYHNYNNMEEEEEEEVAEGTHKKSNVLPIWGNEKTMNLNHLLLTNIQSSQYFKGEYIWNIYYIVIMINICENASYKLVLIRFHYCFM